MSTSNRCEQSLEVILEDYLTRVDNGNAPDTDEFVARYPEWADELRRFFDDLAVVDTALASEKAGLRTAGLGQWFGDSESPGSLAAKDPPGRSDLPCVKGFHLLDELGGGSQGIVYKALQLGTKRTVALKVIREGAFASKVERRRFENEVELASRLTHPNVVAVYSCGQDAGRDYYAMEYVEGEPLDVYLSLHMLDIKATLELFLQICDAISYAHRHGVIHRDMKPSNVIVDSFGQARIVDFGLAKGTLGGLEREDAAVTQVGEFAGTWYYASPEQVMKDPTLLDTRTDVYSLGVILYEMLTDCLPYPMLDESREAIGRHILHTPPKSPSSIRREIDDDLDTIVVRALSKEPERRYQSMSALGEDIRRNLAGEPIEAKRDSSWYLFRKLITRYRWRVATATVGLIALLTFAVTIAILYSQAVAAHATTEVRSQIVRQSQRYLMDTLDELNWTGNRLAEIAAAHPDLPEVRALEKVPYQEPLSLLGAIVADMPEGICETMLEPDSPGYSAAVTWLSTRERELSEVVELSRTRRFVFKTDQTSRVDFALRDRPAATGEAARVCEALVARAVQEYRHADHEAAVASLEAARSIALDLADGRLLHDKALSILARSRTYDAILTILEKASARGDAVQPYLLWVFRDPPLVQYRLAIPEQWHKRSQLLEAASIGKKPGSSGYMDLHALDRVTGGHYQAVGAVTPERRAAARLITPEQTVEVVEDYFREVEGWDQLTFDALNARSEHTRQRLQANPAFELSRPLLSDYLTAFRVRGRVRAKRAATILAAHVCRYHAMTGQWPRQIADAIPQGGALSATDPYVGATFGYALDDGAPMLYSINEDHTDNGGREGAWGDPGTDVVFFRTD